MGKLPRLIVKWAKGKLAVVLLTDDEIIVSQASTEDTEEGEPVTQEPPARA